MSQEELAAKATGGNKSRISDLENGKTAQPIPSTVRAIADVLDISEEELAACYGSEAAATEVDLQNLAAIQLEQLISESVRLQIPQPDFLEQLQARDDELVAKIIAGITDTGNIASNDMRQSERLRDLFLEGEYERLIRDLNRRLDDRAERKYELDRADFFDLVLRGTALKRSGRHRDALDDLEKALQLDLLIPAQKRAEV